MPSGNSYEIAAQRSAELDARIGYTGITQDARYLRGWLGVLRDDASGGLSGGQLGAHTGDSLAIAAGGVLGAFIGSTLGAYDRFYPTEPGSTTNITLTLPSQDFSVDPGGAARYGFQHNAYCLEALEVGDPIRPVFAEFCATYAPAVIDDLVLRTGGGAGEVGDVVSR